MCYVCVIYQCVCMWVCIFTGVHIPICMCVSLCTYLRMGMGGCIYLWVRVSVCVRVGVCVCVCAGLCVCVCVSGCGGVDVCVGVNCVVWCMCRCGSAYFCLHVFVGVSGGVYGCMYRCICVYACTCVCVCRPRYVCALCGYMSLVVYLWESACTYLLACGCTHIYRPLYMNRTYILSRRQPYQHTQDMRFSSIGPGTGRTCAKEDAYGGLSWRLEDGKTCTLFVHRWAVGGGRGGGNGQGAPACNYPPARGWTWVAGA